jgi:hypothetical protein
VFCLSIVFSDEHWHALQNFLGHRLASKKSHLLSAKQSSSNPSLHTFRTNSVAFELWVSSTLHFPLLSCYRNPVFGYCPVLRFLTRYWFILSSLNTWLLPCVKSVLLLVESSLCRQEASGERKCNGERRRREDDKRA